MTIGGDAGSLKRSQHRPVPPTPTMYGPSGWRGADGEQLRQVYREAKKTGGAMSSPLP